MILMATLFLSACNYLNYDRPFYYAYVQKQSDGTIVRSDSVSSKEIPSYTDKAIKVANSVLGYKEVGEVAVFYSKEHVIVGYTVKNEQKEVKVPSATNGMLVPPNEQALKLSIVQTVKNDVGDGTVYVQVAEKKEFERAFKNFMDEMKGMNRIQIQEKVQEIVNKLRM